MAQRSSLPDLLDIPLPDFPSVEELQIPADLDFDALDEAFLLGETPSLIVDDAAGNLQQEQGPNHLSWLPPPSTEGPLYCSGEAGESAGHQQWQHARPGPSAAHRGRVQRKAEQNRCWLLPGHQIWSPGHSSFRSIMTFSPFLCACDPSCWLYRCRPLLQMLSR